MPDLLPFTDKIHREPYGRHAIHIETRKLIRGSLEQIERDNLQSNLHWEEYWALWERVEERRYYNNWMYKLKQSSRSLRSWENYNPANRSDGYNDGYGPANISEQVPYFRKRTLDLLDEGPTKFPRR